MQQYWDPLRKKMVAATPEEKVRQWFISVLRDSSGVPEHLMMSEAGLEFGQKKYRADILIWDRSGQPLAIVECKRPEVELTAAVLEQAMRYNMVLGVKWLFVTNGKSTYLYRNVDGTFLPQQQFPSYEGMLLQPLEEGVNP